MKKLIRFFISLFISCVLLSGIFSLQASAQDSLDPNLSNTKTALTTETIPILADPVTPKDTFVQLRLSFTNAEILDFIPSGFTATAACENQKSIFNNKLCVNISNEKGFKKGELLGNIVVKWGNITDEATIMRYDTNAYVSPGDTFYQPGLLFRYPILNVDVPVTNTSSNLTNQIPIIILLVFGIILIFLGIFTLKKQFRKNPTL